MANLIVLNEQDVERTVPAVHGEEITIKAPCNCGDVTGVQVAGVIYPFYDAAGKPMRMGTGLFTKDNLIRVLIDTEHQRSTIINHAITPPTIGAASEATYTASINNTWSGSSSTGYEKTVTVSGMKSTDNPIVDILLGTDLDANAAYLEAWGLITRITTADNSIKLYANTGKPATAFNIQLKVVR